MNYICEKPVLLIFFNRPDTLKKVFEKIREAKPKVLFLAQDGPRNDNDLAGIEACRKVVENIDWDCEVIRDYSEINLGCGHRVKSAIDSVLNKFESAIILEDDCVPSPTFFRYCDELLEKYKDDDRIAYISGLNHFETWDCGDYDYFFSRAAAIWGWATWRRAWNQFYDYHANGINDDYRLRIYKQQVGNKRAYVRRLNSLKKANNAALSGEKLSYWAAQWGFAEFTQNMLAVVPQKNQICNVGVGTNSTHSNKSKITKYIKYKNMVFIPTYELNFPLKHLDFCACDLDYHNLVLKTLQGSRLKNAIKKIINHII